MTCKPFMNYLYKYSLLHFWRAGCDLSVAKPPKVTQAKHQPIINVFIATVEFIATAIMMKILKIFFYCTL